MTHPLMNEAVSEEHFADLISFLESKPRLTADAKVKEFEEEWSKWLGVKYSVFVNSGSSANILTWKALKTRAGERNEIIVPPLTWVSDIASLIYAGFIPKFVDINLSNLAIDETLIEKNITNKTYGIFLTHVLGLNGLTENIINLCKKNSLEIIEDCCESHGTRFKNQRVGTFGLASNFSFYFAHHLTTIEGGMISTNDKELYHQLRRLRGHGMIRESGDEQYNANLIAKHSDLHPEFIFPELGYNFRSSEINAVLGLSQLKNLDLFIDERKNNFKHFTSRLSNIFYKDFEFSGQSNYAFIIILKKPDQQIFKKLIAILSKNGIEFRRGLSGGGNQLRQPYLSSIEWSTHDFLNTEHIHHYSLYIGNYPGIKRSKLNKLIEIINSSCI
jgi:CDP-6-deoxy-D-xylo-4-hexulose-3-dehydrase